VANENYPSICLVLGQASAARSTILVRSNAVDNDYDGACRRLARLSPVGVLSWLLTAFAEHLRFAHWLDTRSAALPGVPQGIRDTLAELRELLSGRAWAFLLEFQGEPDPQMFGRLLVYLGTTWLELRPDPLPGSRYHLAAAVINLTGTDQSMPASWDMTLPGPDGVACLLRVRERYLQEEAALPLLRAIHSGQQARVLLPWIVLMQTDDVEQTQRLWLELWNGESDEQLKSEYLTLTRVFVELSAQRERWRPILEGLVVQTKSPYLEAIRKESQARTIVQFLRAKFGDALPDELVHTIEQTRDLARLEQWTRLAATAVTLDEFRRDGGV
jgi:hypothetical protein